MLDGEHHRGMRVWPDDRLGNDAHADRHTICGNGQNLLLSCSAEMPDTTGNEICEDAPDSSE
jgi:hypothetical protein